MNSDTVNINYAQEPSFVQLGSMPVNEAIFEEGGKLGWSCETTRPTRCSRLITLNRKPLPAATLKSITSVANY
jgi:hypothetical protein